MDDKLANLSPAKRALLEKMLKKRTADAIASRDAPIPRRLEGEAAELSYNQEILWVMDQITPSGTAYNVPRASRIFGRLDMPSLQQTLDALVARHEILRTTYAATGGAPRQIVSPPRPVEIRFADLRALPDEGREAEAQRLLVAAARYGFDLSRDLMLRAEVLRLSEEEHVLLLLTHHIASDGWSKAVLFREFSALYDAFARSEAPALPEMPIQYADFAVWQRRLLEGEALERQLTYWKKQLAGAPEVIDLPLDRPRPKVQSYRGLHQALFIPRPSVDALARLAQREGATLFMVLLAAFQSLLFRYTQQVDIVVGTPIAGRRRKELEGLIGFLTNTLVLRTDFAGDPTFREVIRRVRDTALSAYDNQDLPFERLVRELNPDRSLSHAPLFQVMFVLQNNPAAERVPTGLTMSPMKIERGNAKFDLLLSLTEHPDGLSGSLEYATDLFEPATMTRLRGHFRALLDALVTSPDEKVSALPLLTDGERHQILVAWNDTATAYPRDLCLHQIVEAQAARTPETLAVLAADGGRLTYRELDERSARLARFLRARGVDRETPVGLCLPRSIDMVVAMLAALKAGGACLPLDPAYPKERLALMLEDAGAKVVLTTSSLAPSLPPSHAALILLDAQAAEIARERAEGLTTAGAPDDLAYVLFTSGSTGKPKGVLLHHRGIVNFATQAAKRYGFSAEDRVLQFASTSFDAHIEEIYPTLMVGGAVLLRDDEVIASTAYFTRWLEERAVTVADLPTAYWHEWVRDLVASGVALPPRLRAVIVGGEAPLSAAYASWVKVPGAAHVRWFNTVAPTECTVVTAVHEPEPGVTEIPVEIPIGRPLGNTTCYVLDPRQNPVPVGVAGEWVIGGLGVARGYLNRPAETEARFLRDPWSAEKGARMYRTGDRARYLPDGSIVLMGRLDQQVKIRGFRVELGEIEAALAEHPGVSQSVVLAREDEPGQKRLVGYVVLFEEKGATAAELKTHLKSRLPEYMIPAAILALPALPLTANGKVDRRVLPAPDREGTGAIESFVAPRSPVEQILAEMWIEILKVPRVSVFDNFFDLGGHSLLATRVASRVREAFAIDLPLRRFFEEPTLVGLSIAVIEALATRAAIEEAGGDFAAAEF
jgi:amino acid adenylation domain-containing protein